ncbi:MAG: hypothetical protein U9R43_03885 [Thermodesulfobacteriota bacterium]|nr:hypothetical protein [Thermodesulfobacteriota bacterium]
MNKLVILTVMIMISLFISVDMAQAGKTGNRQIKQQKRIHQGLASGELTPGEALRLEKEQQHIQKTKQEALKDDKVTPKERIRLERQQNRANRHIYRFKHNEKAK